MPAGKLRRVKRNKGLTKTQAKTVKKIARSVAMSIPEKKTFGYQEENVQLYHNKALYLASWLKCKQGDQDPNNLVTQTVRVGDEFYLRSVNIRFWLSNKLDRPNVMYKLYLFWYDSNVTLSDTVCYFTQTNKMLDRINNETISVIDSKTIFSGPSYENGTEKHEHSYLCTLKGSWKNRKIIYDEGGFVPKKRDIGTIVVCYDAYGTLQTDNIASLAYNGNINIQDP
ncbi:MAG: putative capsid protein [Circoviridae sp.]|nr:MAG: putative capsid protein [Circoviridae sp.]